MVDLLSALSELFDLVILDTAAPSVVPDAIPLMRLVTGVVIVARKNVITRDAARQLRDQLTKLRVPTLGVVANEMSDDAPEYGHYVSATQPPEAASTLARRPHLQTSQRLADAEAHRAR
jgi:Mrp family chromosome partitioning ATPase